MRKFCDRCGKEVETEIIIKKEAYDVRGESVEVDARVLVCADCGEEFFCESLDNETLIRAFNEYRQRHKLLLPEEIKNIREQYGLSRRDFSRLLGWPEEVVRRYEGGSLQDEADNSLLLLLREPENMRAYLKRNKSAVSKRQMARLTEKSTR